MRLPNLWAGVAFVVLMLAGCTSGSASTQASPTPTQVPPSRSTTSPAATETPTAPGDPVVYGPTALVTGQESCTLTDDVHARWTANQRHARDGWFTCVVTSNDPRVAGTARYTWNADRWGTGAENGSMVQWGTTSIRNSGGAWVGRFEGIYTSETGDTVFYVLTGSGDYAGLSYYRWEYKTFGTTWPTEGLIFPGTIPSR